MIQRGDFHWRLCCIAMTNYTNTYACITMQWRWATQFFRKIYLSLYWKGFVWEGVGDRTELQHMDPHSIGHNRIFFPLSWAAQPGPVGPLCFVLVLSTVSYLQLIDFLSSLGLYNNLTSTLLPVSVTISHSLNASTVKVIFWYSSTGCICYLYRCISYFDSPAGSDVNIQHLKFIKKPRKSTRNLLCDHFKICAEAMGPPAL